MDIDFDELVANILGAMSGSLGESWDKVSDYAESEAKKLVQTGVDIGRLALEEKVSTRQATLMLSMQANTAKLVFLAVEGMGLLAVEAAINAGLKVLRDAVNAAAGVTVFREAA